MKTAQGKTNRESVHYSIVNHGGQSFFSGHAQDSVSFFSPSSIQLKLKIGSPDDQYERQADMVADAVVNSPAPDIQQQAMTEEEEWQLKSGSGLTAKAAPPDISQKIQTIGGGIQLPGKVNSEVSQKIGADFSNVNIHTGSEASRLNQSLGARAFTHGSDVFFNSGEYNPGSREGKRLLAHELTHVVQQGGVKSSNVKFKSDDSYSSSDNIGNNSFNNIELSSIPSIDLKVIQKQDVNGRIWTHSENDEGETERDSVMVRWTVPNWSISNWESNLGNLDDTQAIMGFFVFAAYPELAGCDHDTMLEFIRPFVARGETIVSESGARGLSEHVLAWATDGNISTSLIENYYNNATAPSETQIEDFFVALMSHNGEVSLQDVGFGDLETWLLSGQDFFNTRIAKHCFNILSPRFISRALNRIAIDPDLRSVSAQGVAAMGEYTNEAGRNNMFAEASVTAAKGLDLLGQTNQTSTGRNNAYNLIRQSGSTMQAILNSQEDIDDRAKATFNSVFDGTWSLIPGGGAITGALKEALKSTISRSIESMLTGTNFEQKIDRFRQGFNQAAMNLVEPGILDENQANIASNTLFSSSASID